LRIYDIIHGFDEIIYEPIGELFNNTEDRDTTSTLTLRASRLAAAQAYQAVRLLYTEELIDQSIQDAALRTMNCMNRLNATTITAAEMDLFDDARLNHELFQYRPVGKDLATIVYSHC
jgi:hypothetical protein